MKEIKFPRPLQPGDKIAIVSPAGPIDSALVYGAAEMLRGQGYRVDIGQHALGHNGQYSGTDHERYADLRRAVTDPEVRAILCSRGGYGVVHLLDDIKDLPWRDDPKWVIGFSDISALHALMHSQGIASIHGSMAKALMLGPDNEDNAMTLDILRGERPSLQWPSHRYDRPGLAEGTLLGGNLAVLSGLVDTPYDMLQPDTILFIEDVSEPIYKIERMLYQLRLSGVLPRLRGLIVGQFTDYKPNENYHDMETMIRDMVAPYGYPVAFGAPIGHVDHNVPVIEGAHVTLRVPASGDKTMIYWQ